MSDILKRIQELEKELNKLRTKSVIKTNKLRRRVVDEIFRRLRKNS